MTNPNIVEIVLNTISKYKIKPENIIMEITESIFIDDFDLIRQRMIELSNAGIVFYLDDFGTGFSNFANVITLPFSTIKIDRSFVQMMEQNAEMISLIDNLIKTFKESGLKILVEGVENDIQDKLVKDAGRENDFVIESAATSTEEIGNDIHRGAREKLTQKGIPFTKRHARRITADDYAEFDLIIGMDVENLYYMQREWNKDPDDKIKLLLTYTGKDRDIADPWYTGNFDDTYNDLLTGCSALLKTLL